MAEFSNLRSEVPQSTKAEAAKFLTLYARISERQGSGSPTLCCRKSSGALGEVSEAF
jgi:hypothetical protein